DYKYGGATHFIMSGSVDGKINLFGWHEISPSYTIFITDEAIFVQKSFSSKLLKKITRADEKGNETEWVELSSLKLNKVSQDDHFHCNDKIKPKRVRYIKN
ncbi:hypothetical protein, partial [Erwinia sp. OPT-41]